MANFVAVICGRCDGKLVPSLDTRCDVEFLLVLGGETLGDFFVISGELGNCQT